jgi:hypothetical protein
MEPFFTNPETESRFESVDRFNVNVHFPKHYKGRLSDIPPTIGEKLIASGYKRIREKQKPPASSIAHADAYGPAM